MLPRTLLKPAIKWFHLVTGHPGEKRLEMTLKARYYHPEIRHEVLRFKCDACQRHKLPGKGYGLLPKRELRIAPWEEVTVDLFGPWHIKVNRREVEFKALTCIDTASNLVELICVDNKTSEHIKNKFMQSWFTRYS